MSSGSVSDAGEVGEGEGPKVVQSSFREPSIMTKVAIKEPVSNPEDIKKEEKVLEEVKTEQLPSEAKPEKSQQNENEMKKAKKSAKNKKKVKNELDFEIPKMIGIPILNKDTVNPNTFDLDQLLNPEVQKLAFGGHRFANTSGPSNGKIPTSPKNHIKKNIQNSKLYNNTKQTVEVPSEIPEIINKKSKCDVDERFYQKAKKTEEKIKNLKALKEIHEVDGCTFKPQIKAKRQTKTYEEFYDYMKNFSEKKEKKLKNMKEEEEKAKEKSLEFTHQPKLCEKSLQMIARKSDLEESTFDRLHRLYKGSNKLNSSGKESVISEAKSESSLSFHPTVNKKSQMMLRPEPVEKILYDDALRRINKEKEPPAPPASKFITHKSEKVLIEKLKRDFEDAYCCIEADVSGGLNYTKMIELFKLLYLVKDEHKKEEERLLLLDSWKILCGNSESLCKKESLVSFLIALMGFYEEWMGYSTLERPGISESEANKIHTKFDLFYTNRISVVNKSTMNKSYKNTYEYTFHPQTVPESEILAQSWREQHRTGGKIEDMLIAERQKTLKKLQDKRALLEEAALEECSFQPIIEQMPDEFRIYGTYEKEDLTSEYFKLLNDPKFQGTHKGILLHDLSRIVNDKKLNKANEVLREKLDKELENCTFSPKLEERILPEGYTPPEYKSSIISNETEKNKSINSRSNEISYLSAINSPKEVKKNVKGKKKENVSAKKSDSIKLNSEKKGNTLKNSQKFLEDEPEKKEEGIKLESNNGEIAIFSINIGGKSDKLTFNLKTDDPTFKVLDFSKIFGLKKADEYKLVKELTLIKQNY